MTPLELPAIRDLKQFAHWLLWDLVPADPKPRKVPRCATGGNASSTDPATWSSFEEAEQARQDKGHTGVGFVFAPLFGIDLDGCRNPETDEIAAWAWDIMRRVPTYYEVSPTGTGVHGIGYGRLPDGRRRVGSVEMYDWGRYFTFTGQHVDGTATTLEPCFESIVSLHKELFPKPATAARQAEPTIPLDLGDDAIIKKMRAANPKADRLWQGDLSDYAGDHSRADAALCSDLGWWFNADVSRVDTAFRQSALYREKWEREDYRQRTLTLALSGFVAGYTGRPTPTAPGLPDDDCAEQRDEILRLRGELDQAQGVIETQKAVIARLTASEKQARAEVYNLWQVLGKKHLKTEGKLGISICKEIADAYKKGAEPGQPIYTTRPTLGSRVGVGDSTVTVQLKQLGKRGLIDHESPRVWVPEQVDTVTGELQPAHYERQLIITPKVDGETFAKLLGQLAALPPLPGEQEPQHGGKWEPRCPEHPHAKVVKRLHCGVCNRVLTDDDIPADDDEATDAPCSDFESMGADTPTHHTVDTAYLEARSQSMGDPLPCSHFESIRTAPRPNRRFRTAVPARCDDCGRPAQWTDRFGATWCDTCAPPLDDLDLAASPGFAMTGGD